MDLGGPNNLEPKAHDVDPCAEYCRSIEAYLCRKNEGHLIRIVGPSFDLVRGWQAKGIPLKVAYQGIDRCVERYYAKGPKRRPVQIDFCAADVLDAFDEWRRAVGISGATDATGATSAAGATGATGAEDTEATRRESLPAHLDRAIARLTALRGGSERALDPILDDVIRELDAARAGAKGLRGQARADLLSRLAQLDASLVAAGRAVLDPPIVTGLTLEADDELRAFRGRMAPDAYERSRAACVDRLVRERLKLPVLSLD
jgi:hypothetical protein